MQGQISSDCESTDLQEHLTILTECIQFETNKIVMRKNCITPKLVAALETCQLGLIKFKSSSASNTGWNEDACLLLGYKLDLEMIVGYNSWWENSEL